MDIGRISAAVDNNGRVLDALIHVLGDEVAKNVRRRIDEVQKQEDERSYLAQLSVCKKRVDELTARRSKAGSGCVIFGRADNGDLLASGFNAMTEENQKLFTGCDEGDVITLAEGTKVTIEGVFDLRKPEPPKSDIASARMKGRKKGRR